MYAHHSFVLPLRSREGAVKPRKDRVRVKTFARETRQNDIDKSFQRTAKYCDSVYSVTAMTRASVSRLFRSRPPVLADCVSDIRDRLRAPWGTRAWSARENPYVDIVQNRLFRLEWSLRCRRVAGVICLFISSTIRAPVSEVCGDIFGTCSMKVNRAQYCRPVFKDTAKYVENVTYAI